MKILVFGHKGQLGNDLMRAAGSRGIDCTGADLPEYNITDTVSVGQALDDCGPVSAVINAAAYTAVDLAESSADLAYAVNRDGAGFLSAACQQRGTPLIHISTDYVFNGMQTRPYRTDDAVAPQGVYACSKAEGEDAVRRQNDHHLILRVSWLFGQHGNNFVKTMLRLGREKESIQVVDDQVGSPTYAGDLADALISAAKRISGEFSEWGTFHYCNQGALTWYAFARKIFSFARPYESLSVKEVVPILTAHYPTPAPRPHYSVLDCSRFDQTFSLTRRPWHKALEEMIKGLYPG